MANLVTRTDFEKYVQADAKRMAVGAATVTAQLQAVRDGLTDLKETQKETNELIRQLGNRGENLLLAVHALGFGF